ncbi:MAG TPA: hypothetical protein PLZ55_01575 [bacterium]|nr:hypothetical protein [bacterium]HPO07329.1 hypothetical protein [bacterium]HQP96919.1 hypothetical protein [bacterium]
MSRSKSEAFDVKLVGFPDFVKSVLLFLFFGGVFNRNTVILKIFMDYVENRTQTVFAHKVSMAEAIRQQCGQLPLSRSMASIRSGDRRLPATGSLGSGPTGAVEDWGLYEQQIA